MNLVVIPPRALNASAGVSGTTLFRRQSPLRGFWHNRLPQWQRSAAAGAALSRWGSGSRNRRRDASHEQDHPLVVDVAQDDPLRMTSPERPGAGKRSTTSPWARRGGPRTAHDALWRFVVVFVLSASHSA